MKHIITIVGSMRFKEAMMFKYVELSLKGHVVLLPVIGDHLEVDDELQEKLMMLHRDKIDMCNEILVMNIGGYIGYHTYEEIGYAVTKGKGIKYFQDIFA